MTILRDKILSVARRYAPASAEALADDVMATIGETIDVRKLLTDAGCCFNTSFDRTDAEEMIASKLGIKSSKTG